MRIALIIGVGLLVSACVQAPVFNAKGHALVKSSHTIVSVNGTEISPVYKVELKTGENTIIVVYPTYRFRYHCTFVWQAVAETVYEVVDRDKQFPLTLYRWVRRNALWSVRLDRVDPISCERD